MGQLHIKILRANDWWDYKLPPILAVGYSTIIFLDKSITSHILDIAIVLLSLIFGAIFVSFINDITDIDDDFVAGKENRMTSLSKARRSILLSVSILLGMMMLWFYKVDINSSIYYLLAWLVFALYSVPPFRFKKNVYLGILADASGSSLLPSLLMLSFIYHQSGNNIDSQWIILIGLWSMLLGIRGILWHQYADKENDLKSKLNTFATRFTSTRLKQIGLYLLVFELAILFCILLLLNLNMPYIFLSLYLLLLLIRHKKFDTQIVPLIAADGKQYHILFNEYYQAFFPIALLVSAGLSNSIDWIWLGVHLILFHKTLNLICRDYFRFFESIFRKVYIHKP